MATSDTSHGQVHIRNVEDADVELFFEHQLDPQASQMAAFPPRERGAFLAHWDKIRADQTVVTQAIVAAGQVVGNVGSWEQSGQRLVGYWISRDHWGRGIATTALRLLLDRVTSRPVHAYVAVHNSGSIRVLEKCGFRRVPPDDLPPPTAESDGIEEVALVLES